MVWYVDLHCIHSTLTPSHVNFNLLRRNKLHLLWHKMVAMLHLIWPPALQLWSGKQAGMRTKIQVLVIF